MQDRIKKARDFFAKNPKQEVCYITSDLNVFKARHYADDWASRLEEKKVHPVRKDVLDAFDKVKGAVSGTSFVAPSADLTITGGEAQVTVTQDDLDNNPELVKQCVAVGDTVGISPESTDDADSKDDAADEGADEQSGDAGQEAPVEADERTELVAKFTELYGKAPAWNISLTKLKAAIAEKEAATETES